MARTFQNPTDPSSDESSQGMSQITTYLERATERSVVKRALVMAVVVGTLLVGINHGSCIYAGHFNGACFFQSALTFLVPYMVSTVSSVMAMSDLDRSGK